mmetsp:Transcript_15730/g.29393  ORF Transcript_15730/g.29393 Transcript_15730/m.29393 type:complete len:215 (-) Transcript_15730:1212-1856(-)
MLLVTSLDPGEVLELLLLVAEARDLVLLLLELLLQGLEVPALALLADLLNFLLERLLLLLVFGELLPHLDKLALVESPHGLELSPAADELGHELLLGGDGGVDVCEVGSHRVLPQSEGLEVLRLLVVVAVVGVREVHLGDRAQLQGLLVDLVINPTLPPHLLDLLLHQPYGPLVLLDLSLQLDALQEVVAVRAEYRHLGVLELGLAGVQLLVHI